MSDGMSDAYRAAREYEAEQSILEKDPVWVRLDREAEAAKAAADRAWERANRRRRAVLAWAQDIQPTGKVAKKTSRVVQSLGPVGATGAEGEETGDVDLGDGYDGFVRAVRAAQVAGWTHILGKWGRWHDLSYLVSIHGA